MKSKFYVESYNIYVIAAFICILFVRFIEGGLDYRFYSGGALYLFLWAYEFIAIPGFFFFITLYLGSLITLNKSVKLPDMVSGILRYSLLLLILSYLIFSFLNLFRIISIHFNGFISPYSLFLFLLGILTVVQLSPKQKKSGLSV